MARFPILSFAQTDAASFLEFWGSQYHYKKEHLYADNIGKPITSKSIGELFEWRNGSILWAKKKTSVEKYLALDERIRADSDKASLKTFLRRPGGAIWRIFWLHIQHPERFPIYDQHVHRAMAKLCGWDKLEISVDNVEKLGCYLDQYCPFVASFGSVPVRKLDRALWAFGRFLSLNYEPVPATGD